MKERLIRESAAHLDFKLNETQGRFIALIGVNGHGLFISFPFHRVPPAAVGAHPFFEAGGVADPRMCPFAGTCPAMPCFLLCVHCRGKAVSDSDMEGTAISYCQEAKKNACWLLFQSQTGLDLFWHIWYFVIKTRPVLAKLTFNIPDSLYPTPQ